jgi:predicted amino acid dehydrogenase
LSDVSASFGFIVHPLTGFQRRVFGVRAFDWHLATGRSNPHTAPVRIAENTLQTNHVELKGTLVSLPGLPEELLVDQSQTLTQLIKAADLCAAHGAEIIGLGGVAAMVGGQGKALSRAIDLPVTSGNHLTAETALQTVLRVINLLPSHMWRISIVGLPSPVGILLVKKLVQYGVQIELVAKSTPTPLRKLLDSLVKDWGASIEVVNEIESITSPVLVAASSTGAGIRSSQIPSNTVVIDVAAPADIIEDVARNEVLVLDGEYLSPPSELKGDLWQSVYTILTHQPSALLACFVEPMLIALSNRKDLCGVGRTLCPQKAGELGQLATQYGFLVDGLYRRGRLVDGRDVTACIGL